MLRFNVLQSILLSAIFLLLPYEIRLAPVGVSGFTPVQNRAILDDMNSATDTATMKYLEIARRAQAKRHMEVRKATKIRFIQAFIALRSK